MASSYPGALDTTTKFPQTVEDDTDSTSGVDLGTSTTVGFLATWMRDAGDALIKIETELGADVSGTFSTVKARLDANTTCRKTADQSNSTTTPANITDLVFPVTIGAEHTFEFFVAYSAAATTTGVGFDVDVPALNAGGYVSLMQQISGRAANPAVGGAMALTTVPYHLHQVADATSPGSSEGVAVANAVYMAYVFGICSNPSAAGNIQLRWRSEVAAASTVKKGSWGRMYVN